MRRTLTAIALPWAFLSHPTDQLVVPGHAAGTEVTPEGYLYTGHTELVFRAGPQLHAWRQPVRTLADGRWPVLSSTKDLGGLRYRLEVFAAPVEGRPVDFVRWTLSNPTPVARTGHVAAAVRWSGGALKADGATRRFRFPRPVANTGAGFYFQPGSAFDPGATHAFGDRTVERDGRVLFTFPGPDPRWTVRTDPRPDDRGPVRPATVFGQASLEVPLAPGQRVSADYRLPVEPIAADDPALATVRDADHATARRAVIDGWKATLVRVPRIELPERKVRDAFTASLVTILQSRHRAGDDWVQTVNVLRYKAFCLRDAAMMAHALDLAGLHQEAREDLDFFAHWQREDGLYVSREGQLDGFGEALWALGEHARRTGDVPWARAQLPRVDRAVAWLQRARAANDGLLPPSDPHDNELVRGRLAGDAFWAVGGLDAAVGLARVAGDDDRERAWGAERASLAARVARAVEAARLRSGGAIPPSLDGPGGVDWGNLWAAWPSRVLPARSAAVSATLRRARRRFSEGIATWGKTRRDLHHYLGFRVWETELVRGEQDRVVDGLYASLAHTTSTHGGFETGVRPWSGRANDDNLAPHGWFAAEYVELVRNMLVREEGDGLELLSAVPDRWLVPGERVSITEAPTARGPVSVALLPRRGGATLRWDAAVPDGTPLRWHVPAGARDVHAPGLGTGARVLTLPGPRGELTVRWRLRRTGATSFAATAHRLAAGYVRRGLRPPSGTTARG